MTVNVVPVAAILAFAIGLVHAQGVDVPSLLKEKGCVACHHESKPRIGPSFESIAAKRCEDPSAALVRFKAKLRDGAGHPKAALADDQFNQMVHWTCSIKRD